MSSIKVSDTMTRFPEFAFPGTTVASAKAAMEKWGIRHLPILDNNKLVGIVTERDLEPHLHERNRLLRDIMVTNIYKVHEEQYLHKVVLEMAEGKYGCAVVTNDKEDIVGIFTTIDALMLLHSLLKKTDYSTIQLHQLSWSSPNYMI